MPSPADGARREAGGGEARRINSPLGERFAQSLRSYDADARTVELIVATETMVRMPGWTLGLCDDYYYEILDCSAAAVDLAEVRADNCPVLDAHNRWSVKDQLGKLRDARCEGGTVVAVCAFGQSEGAKAVEAEVAGSTPPKVSAGYRREQAIFERFEGEIPVYRITKWTLREASFVPIAADPRAGVRSAEQNIFPCIINEGTRIMSEQNGKAAGAANGTGAAAPVSNGEGARGGEGGGAPANNGQGAAALTRFTYSSGDDFVRAASSYGDAVVTRAKELVAQNERGEISVENANAELLKAQAAAQRAATDSIATGGRAATVTTDAREKFVAGATAAILQRAGLTDLVQRAAKARGEEIDLDPGEFRGVRNAELARISLERAGHRIDTFDRDQIVGQAIVMRADGPYQSTSDFSVALENVMNKALQAAYIIQPDTWRQWAGVGSVGDFREHSRYLLGSIGRLHRVLEDGEVKNLVIPDAAKESIKAVENGGIVGLTRQAIVNDDLGIFNQISQDLGRAAKRSVEIDAYAVLTSNGGLGPIMRDGKTLFHADHGNIADVAAPPSIASFEAMDLKMSAQQDVSGNDFLDIPLHAFLAPRAMRGEALIINDSQYDTETAGKFQRPNKVRGLFTTITGTPRLNGTRWYGFADPAQMPAIEVVFLNGEQEPRIEQKDGWRVSGVEWRVLFDYGVGGVNYRAAQTNAG
jgi:hypothetical protein